MSLGVNLSLWDKVEEQSCGSELDISPKITEASVQSFILLEVQDRHLFSADFLTESQDWSLVVPCLLFWAALVASPGHGLRQGWRAVYEMRGKS
jgi:hypothetical protein